MVRSGKFITFCFVFKKITCALDFTHRDAHTLNTHAHYLKYTLRISTRAHTLPVNIYTRTLHIDTYIRHRQIYTCIYTSIYNTRRCTHTKQNTRTVDIHIHYQYAHTHTLNISKCIHYTLMYINAHKLTH